MEFDKNSPIYLQIVFEMKGRILNGKLHSGDKMPSVRDLADELKVNPNTVVRAYQELERDGITETRRGMGTFIVEGEDKNTAQIKKEIGMAVTAIFVQRMHEAGVSDDEILECIKKVIEQNKAKKEAATNAKEIGE